jgi:hypothetical protein
LGFGEKNVGKVKQEVWNSFAQLQMTRKQKWTTFSGLASA